MKIISLIIAIITGLFLLSTLICGLWIRSKHLTDEGSLKFHAQIGITSVILGMITVVLFISKLIKG